MVRKWQHVDTTEFQRSTRTTDNVSSAGSRGKTVIERTGIDKEDSETGGSFFSSLIESCGIRMPTGRLLSSPEGRCVLDVDHAIFIRNITETLRSGESNTDTFLGSLYDLLQNPELFHLLLMPTEASENLDRFIASGPQDSVIRLLLSVDSIQTELILRLLDGLAEEAETEQSCGRNMSELMISQLRYLDHVVDCSKISAKLNEILPQLSDSTQESLIPCIPELLTDEYHLSAAFDLRALMEEKRLLASCVLSTLGKLHLSTESVQEMRLFVFDELSQQMYSLAQLQDVVSFLQESSRDLETAQDMFLQLRDNLDLDVFASSYKTESQVHAAKRFKRDDLSAPGIAILRGLQSSARFPMKKHLGDGMMKALEQVDSDDGKEFDVLMVLILFSSSNRRKRTWAFLKNRIQSGFFQADVFGRTLKFPMIRKEYFKTVVEIAEALLQPSDAVLAQFGSNLYKQCFLVAEGHQQDELVVALVTHVGSCTDSEIKWALKTLKAMVLEFPEDMDRLSFYVTELLGNLSDLSYENVKSVLQIVVDLGLKSTDPADTTLEDLHRLINKKNMASCKKSKMIGLLGGLMLVRSLLSLVDEKEEKLEEAQAMINLLDSRTKDNKNFRSVFFDELSALFADTTDRMKAHTTKVDIQRWLLDKFGTECDTLGSTQNTQPRDLDFESCLEFDLRKGQDSEFPPVEIVCLALSSFHEKILILPSLLRMLTYCCRRTENGNLGRIRWALVSPLRICDEDSVDDFQRKDSSCQTEMCAILYHSANWIREVLNCFTVDSVEEDGLLVARLKHLREAERRLNICLKNISGFHVPVQSLGYSDVSSPIVGKVVTKSGGKQKTKKKGAEEAEVSPAEAEESDQPGPSTRTIEVGQKEKVLSPEKISCFLREIDLSAIVQLLKGGFDTAPEPDGSTLSAKDMLFLLEDLDSKLKHALPATQKRRIPGFINSSEKWLPFQKLDIMGPATVARLIVDCVPVIIGHVVKCRDHLQSIADCDDSVADTTLMLDSPNSQVLQQCIELSFGCLNTLANWNGMNHILFDEFLGKILEGEDSVDSMNVDAKIIWLMDFLCPFEKVLNTRISSCVALLRLMLAVSDRGKKGNDGIGRAQKRIREMATRFLRKDWAVETSKGLSTVYVKELLDAASPESETEILSLIEDLVENGIQAIVSESEHTDQQYKTCNKSTFPVFYQKILSLLVKAGKKFPDKKELKKKEIRLDCIQKWITAIKYFVCLTCILREKICQTVGVMRSAMAEGAKFVEVFTHSGLIRNFEENFQHSRDDIIKLVTTFQKATKNLQRLCTHVKSGNAGRNALPKLVTVLRPALAAYVAKMSTIASYNNCQDAIQIGYLKPRDLLGQKLPDSDNEEEEEEENETNAGADERMDQDVVPESDYEGSEENNSDVDGSDESGSRTRERTRNQSGDSSVSQAY